MIGLVVSRADDASVAIGEQLRSLAEWDERTDPTGSDAEVHYRHGDFELRTFEDWHLELDGVAVEFSEPPAFVAFLSRHAGDTGPLLTAHFTGNFGPAEYGGKPGELARACPNVQRAVVAAFDRHAPEGYDVGVECTHHGPSDVGAPSLFVELGSSESEWNDPAGARAVAQSVLELSGVEPDAGADGGGRDTIAPDAPEARRHVVGFGGGHYAPEFERIVRETDWRVGHVAADWVLGAMGAPEANADLIERAFEQSAASRALLVGDNPELAAVVEDLGHRVVDETFLRATSGVDLALVAALEDALGPVDDGLRFGTPAEGAGADALDEFEVVSLPTDLLAEASGIDQEATLAVLRDRVLAFETVEGGTKPRGRAAVTDAAALDGVVDALADVLATKYDEVVRESAAIVATRETFDPAAAAEAGVPEGPAFGRLAGGDAVDVDGRTVTPEEVSVEETVRFPV
ncbi:D-aminoacyl-tRNA deacylase [Halobellus marinus]|uniref:D-aminoacyl-tRNA deacylase n=1 Tax=Halobellus TaxID=1073986 RepID=UPI0028AEFAB6|nr:D-aminoacyl-tRNA deacylase [Halobellus sp. DFY28]